MLTFFWFHSLLQRDSSTAPLSVGEYISLMNDILEGTETVAHLIQWKKKKGMHNEDADLLGTAWWRLFKIRNPELDSKVGRKYARNRADHCKDSAFRKMYNQVENGFIKSGKC